MFRNFDVRGSSDRSLIYLTLFTAQCLVKTEKIEEKSTGSNLLSSLKLLSWVLTFRIVYAALKELRALATKQACIPGDAGWPLGTLFPVPANKSESDLFRAYFKQAREELVIRLCDQLFNVDGSKNKWWQAFSKRKFMGKELKD